MTGEDAAAAGMPLVPGSTPANTIDSELNLTRDLIVQYLKPIATGGTGATTAPAARTALGLGGAATQPVDAYCHAGANKVTFTWTGSALNLKIDSTNFGPIVLWSDMPAILAALEARVTALENP